MDISAFVVNCPNQIIPGTREFRKLKETKSHSVLFVFPLHLKNHKDKTKNSMESSTRRAGSLLGPISMVQQLYLDPGSFGQGYCFPKKAPVSEGEFLKGKGNVLHGEVVQTSLIMNLHYIKTLFG